MESVSPMHKDRQVDEKPTSSFFPRIIREFDDHDEPMIYGDRK